MSEQHVTQITPAAAAQAVLRAERVVEEKAFALADVNGRDVYAYTKAKAALLDAERDLAFALAAVRMLQIERAV